METIETLDQYQELAYALSLYPEDMLGMMAIGAGIANEAGEVLGNLKKAIRDDGAQITPERRKAIVKELGDTMWYLAALARRLDVDLSDVATQNVTKLLDRQARGVLQGSGDNR